MRDNILKITTDPERRVLWAGSKMFEEPFFLNKYIQIPSVGITEYPEGHLYSRRGKQTGNKEYNKALSEMLGMPPTLYKRLFNRKMGELWVDPVQRYVNSLARGMRGKILCGNVLQIWGNKEILEQCERDGLWNIIPLVFMLEKTPEELKEYFGRRPWKKITKNSFNRNKLLSVYAEHPNFRNFLDVPSTLLQYKIPSGEAKWIDKYRTFPMKDKRRVQACLMERRDLSRMCRQYGREFNPDWSIRRVHEEHENLSRLSVQQRYSDEPFDIPEIEIPPEGNLSARILMNAQELVQEGREMHHCIASYIGNCFVGKYIVVSIMKDGEKSSTLGLRLSSNECKYDQHCSFCNKRPDIDEVKYGAVVCHTINKELNNG